MIRHFVSLQFLTFLGVGITAALANWCTRYALSYSLNYSLSVLLAYCVGICVAFLLNRRFVFPGSPRPMAVQAREFLLINVAFMPVVWVSAVALRYLLRHLAYDSIADGMAHALSLGVPAFATFLIYKFFTFASPAGEKATRQATDASLNGWRDSRHPPLS